MSLLMEMPQRLETPALRDPSPQGKILLGVLEALEQAKVPCCLLHGYENYPHSIPGDVDCLIPAQFLPRKLAEILHEKREEIGARVVQWFEDGAHFIVLAGRDKDGSPVLLQLHVSTRYEMAGRLFLGADEILSGRRQHNGFSIPAAEIEFICVLVNRLCKGQLSDEHGRRLSALFAIAPGLCIKQASRYLLPEGAQAVIDAARSQNWEPVRSGVARLRKQLLSSRATRAPGQRLSRLAGKIRRHLWPRHGFHAVFLGPDGVGKSTTIDTFQRDIAPAFLSSKFLTFAPGLLPQKFAPPKPGGPHSLPPRSLLASLLKAAWWLVCYTLGYCVTVRPTLARGGLVVNHRYLVDAIVDQKRYRYSGPVWLLKMIWAVAPKPDVVFLLDAPPQVIFHRKQEVPFAELAHQVEEYRTTVSRLRIGKIIDASRSRPQVAAEVEWFVLDKLAQRVARQFSLGVSQ